MKRNAVIGRMFGEMEKLRKLHGLPDRMEIIMMDAAFDYKVRNARYRQENEISDVVASRDLKRLSDLGLFMPVGEKRGRYYLAAKPLKAIREKCTDKTMAPNPYHAIKGRAPGQQLSLPV